MEIKLEPEHPHTANSLQKKQKKSKNRRLFLFKYEVVCCYCFSYLQFIILDSICNMQVYFPPELLLNKKQKLNNNIFVKNNQLKYMKMQ